MRQVADHRRPDLDLAIPHAPRRLPDAREPRREPFVDRSQHHVILRPVPLGAIPRFGQRRCAMHHLIPVTGIGRLRRDVVDDIVSPRRRERPKQRPQRHNPDVDMIAVPPDIRDQIRDHSIPLLVRHDPHIERHRIGGLMSASGIRVSHWIQVFRIERRGDIVRQRAVPIAIRRPSQYARDPAHRHRRPVIRICRDHRRRHRAIGSNPVIEPVVEQIALRLARR